MPPTLLIGSGAVRNSWVPVNRALQETFGFVPGGEGSNFAFANLVFQLRRLERAKAQLLVRAFEAFREKRIKEFNDLRTRIGRHLDVAMAGGELVVRPELEMIRRSYFTGAIERVITTNWDGAIDAALPGATICHLHGHVRDTNTLYLPSETAEEPYRREDERKYLRDRITQAFELLDETMQHLIIWGLSLSPLDIELGIVVGEAFFNRRDCRITVIDPRAREVAERVRFQCRLAPIYYGTPDELYLEGDFDSMPMFD